MEHVPVCRHRNSDEWPTDSAVGQSPHGSPSSTHEPLDPARRNGVVIRLRRNSFPAPRETIRVLKDNPSSRNVSLRPRVVGAQRPTSTGLAVLDGRLSERKAR